MPTRPFDPGTPRAITRKPIQLYDRTDLANLELEFLKYKRTRLVNIVFNLIHQIDYEWHTKRKGSAELEEQILILEALLEDKQAEVDRLEDAYDDLATGIANSPPDDS